MQGSAGPTNRQDRVPLPLSPSTLPLHQLCRLPICLLYHQPYLIYTPPFQVVPAYLPKKLHKPQFHSRNTFFQHATMAAVQPRTRSARLVAGFTNKSTQHAPATAPSPHVHHGPPALSIFLTNLNLLDLDQHEDWPGIKAQTFASGGSSAQGLKKRVHCVEWALFQLFALWDPDETKKVRQQTKCENQADIRRN